MIKIKNSTFVIYFSLTLFGISLIVIGVNFTEPSTSERDLLLSAGLGFMLSGLIIYVQYFLEYLKLKKVCKNWMRY